MLVPFFLGLSGLLFFLGCSLVLVLADKGGCLVGFWRGFGLDSRLSSLISCSWHWSLAYQYTSRGLSDGGSHNREEKSQSVPTNTDVCRKNGYKNLWLGETYSSLYCFCPRNRLSLFFLSVLFFFFLSTSTTAISHRHLKNRKGANGCSEHTRVSYRRSQFNCLIILNELSNAQDDTCEVLRPRYIFELSWC
ncbi:hypothetical protein PAHAL_1G450700 [Panicum hallii]|uniref:Uncharacterized protein n=1 Tax=Panicum hallii TaxID=206008 RepID=A0A2S3GTV2_9POAL|nr:hypothetical protein PAHAL_1G450700 [Panicum hallii]